MKHTKGNWKVSVRLPKHNDILIRTNFKQGICAVFDVGKGNGQAEANAQLISASPNLLEACKNVVAYHRKYDSGEGELFGLNFVTTCIAAIRKAEGK